MTSKRAYFWLLGAVVALAIGLSAVAHAPGRRATGNATYRVPAPTVAVVLTLRDGTVSPAVTRVEKGERVLFQVTNAGSTGASLALLGYEDLLPAITLAPGSEWKGELLAERPGDDFAWMVNGKPAGRFVVAGSHLVEGHR